MVASRMISSHLGNIDMTDSDMAGSRVIDCDLINRTLLGHLTT
jgi:hypothetical protein